MKKALENKIDKFLKNPLLILMESNPPERRCIYCGKQYGYENLEKDSYCYKIAGYHQFCWYFPKYAQN